jgi:hypothetical protein
MENLYIAYNGAMPTGNNVLPVIGTTTNMITLLQILPPSTFDIRVVEWGISMDGSPAAVACSLMTTGTVAATVTAHVAAGVQPFNDPNAPASKVTLSTSATGYTSSAEGTITATRFGDYQLLSTNTYVKQFPLGREFRVKAADVLRVRVKAAVAINAVCYVVWKEG